MNESIVEIVETQCTIKYVIKSGDGFLLSLASNAPHSPEMIANSKDPSAAAILAKKYEERHVAEKDCAVMRTYGLEANVVELHIVKYNQ